MMDWIERYAMLLLDYCLRIQSGESLYIRTTPLALPLVELIQSIALQRGARVVLALSTATLDKQLINFGSEAAWRDAAYAYEHAVQTFDCMLTISAPENTRDTMGIDLKRSADHGEVFSEQRQAWSSRAASGALRWCLCVYPTPSLAQEAGMSSRDFTRFVIHACGLDGDAIDYWRRIHHLQAKMVTRLNQGRDIRYVSPNMDISFLILGRTWINSDGRRNMPSGEVFTSPIEDSGNGWVQFDYPLLYHGDEIRNVRFEVRDGEIVTWSAEIGQKALDHLMTVPGARRFGEIAIGTNDRIQQHTKNILFDEKMGGTVHMAIGQSYPETGGKNTSSVHLDFIATMKNGHIVVDGETVYNEGKLLSDESQGIAF